MPAHTHLKAVLAMIAATAMWSIAGVVTRHLHVHDGLVLVFWRSSFAAVAVLLLLLRRQGASALARDLRQGSALLWLSGLFWGVMFTAFMVALTMTTVAQTLIVESLSPLIAALLGWLVLRQPLLSRTWVAIGAAMLGMAWIVWNDLQFAADPRQLLGMTVALAVPLASAANWVSLRRAGHGVPMQPALMIGGALSAVAVAVPAWPLSVDAHDLFWLAVLGAVQLAAPGVLAVWAAQRLAPAEVALLGLLEAVFGTFWAWIGAGETPASSTLVGGALVLAALVGNEAFGWHRARYARERTLA